MSNPISKFDKLRYRYENETGRFINYDSEVPPKYNPFHKLLARMSWDTLKKIMDSEATNEETLAKSIHEER